MVRQHFTYGTGEQTVTDSPFPMMSVNVRMGGAVIDRMPFS